MITLKDIKNNDEIKAYIEQGSAVLSAMGYTEHSFAHAGRTADNAFRLLTGLGADKRVCELAAIAGYMHDIGNAVTRAQHAQNGALISFGILNRMGMPPAEIATVISAIGNHDEKSSEPADEVAAALILADKSDVRRTRVKSDERINFDIHDRVNYAAVDSKLHLDNERKTITLNITIDTELCPVMDYFEIFLNRMVLCRKAALLLELKFELIINENKLL